MPQDQKRGTQIIPSENSEISRRSFLGRSFASVAMASTVFLSACARRMAGGREKVTKAAAHYQNHPNGRQRCGRCVHYVSPFGCEIVAGPISPHGWCRYYKRA